MNDSNMSLISPREIWDAAPLTETSVSPVEPFRSNQMLYKSLCAPLGSDQDHILFG